MYPFIVLNDAFILMANGTNKCMLLVKGLAPNLATHEPAIIHSHAYSAGVCDHVNVVVRGDIAKTK